MNSSNKKYLAQAGIDLAAYESNDSSSCHSDQKEDFAKDYIQR